MAHNRKFVQSWIDMIKVRFRNLQHVQIRDSIEQLIINSNILEQAPFKWIGISYRHGIENNFKVRFQGINKKYGDLGIAIELDTEILKWADDHNVALLSDLYRIAALEALIQVMKKYKLPSEAFEGERAKYPSYPNTIEEVEAMASAYNTHPTPQ